VIGGQAGVEQDSVRGISDAQLSHPSC